MKLQWINVFEGWMLGNFLSVLPWLFRRARRWWHAHAWIKVWCPDCEGTGWCKQGGSQEPHSCCGDCDRIILPKPVGSVDVIGTGVVRVRPFSVDLRRSMRVRWRKVFGRSSR